VKSGSAQPDPCLLDPYKKHGLDADVVMINGTPPLSDRVKRKIPCENAARFYDERFHPFIDHTLSPTLSFLEYCLEATA